MLSTGRKPKPVQRGRALGRQSSPCKGSLLKFFARDTVRESPIYGHSL